MKKKRIIYILVLLLVFTFVYRLIPAENLIFFKPSDKVIHLEDTSVSCRLMNLSMKTVDYDGPFYVLEFFKDTEWIRCTMDPGIRFETWGGYLQPFHSKDFAFGLTTFDELQPGEYRIRKTMEINEAKFYTYCYFTIM